MKRVVNGLIVIDKPTGITSRDTVNQASRWFPKRTRIGHTGTLDPLATGVLVVCLGSATRLAEYVQAMDKTYRAKFILGARSDTDDADGTINATPATTRIDEATIRTALAAFTGEIEQAPPAYSAVKIDGRRAHDLARRGETMTIAPRKVNVYSIEILGFAWPELVIEIRCGKGTYVRSLARDLGDNLGCGAYVKELRRTRVGPFTTAMGVVLDEAVAEVDRKVLPPLAAVSHLPLVSVDDAAVEKLCHGNPIEVPASIVQPAGIEAAILNEGGTLIGVGCIDGGKLRPVKILMGE
jgi:tRNA pseudouridine55 synthase